MNNSLRLRAASAAGGRGGANAHKNLKHSSEEL